MPDFFGCFIFIEINRDLIDSVLSNKALIEQWPCLHHKYLSSALSPLKTRKDIRLVMISTLSSETKCIAEIQKLRETHPDIPVLILDHNPDVFADYSAFSNIFTIDRPKTFEELSVRFKEIFKKEDRFDNVVASPEATNVELELKNEDYVPMRLEDFILTDKSFFNVFIKLGANRFVKILNVGDAIEKEFLAKYIKKGIKELYLPESEQKSYIALSEKVSLRILKNLTNDKGEQTKQVLNLGAAISKSLAHSGINADILDYASSFMNQSITLIKSMRFKSDSVTDFIRSLENNEHTTTVSFIAGILANELGFESSKSIKLVGIAALVHDIGLYDLAPHLMDDHEALEEPENQQIFDDHSKHGADILRASGNFDESLCIAVEQHHLRRRGTGPEHRTNNINIVTEIIGVSDDFYNYAIKGGVTKDKMQVFLSTHLKNFSPQIEKAFMSMLTKKKKSAS